MNREQRRKLIKVATGNGIDKKHAKAYAEISKGTGLHTDAQQIDEDEKIQLNLQAIKSRKNYNVMNEKYKEFVEGNEGVVFTAHKESSNLISLKEQPEWLFWSGDLIRYETKL